MPDILHPLIERLRAAGPAQWERIAREAGVAKTLPRKLVYGDRDNPGVKTVQPLFDYFAAIDRAQADTSPQPATAPAVGGGA